MNLEQGHDRPHGCVHTGEEDRGVETWLRIRRRGQDPVSPFDWSREGPTGSRSSTAPCEVSLHLGLGSELGVDTSEEEGVGGGSPRTRTPVVT